MCRYAGGGLGELGSRLDAEKLQSIWEEPAGLMSKNELKASNLVILD